ncbi:MAG: glutamate synthase large subunit, partial [Vicinamibacterales bacterium]
CDDRRFFFVVSLSSRTLIYKGMLAANQIAGMFPDLTDPALESALALVHQRFSTNTFPSWPLAHPYRYVAHNGEINTLRGNINWMHAREALLASEVLGDDLRKILPIVREGGSDSAIFDNVLELLLMAGRSLPHAILMMIPEPWQNNDTMNPELRAFYEYHASLMEPWDGPASIAFTDGTVIGAVLDRNGLWPSRYYVTKDDLVVMASEVGVLDIPAEDVLIKERLHPGRIFLVDTAQGRIISDEELKMQLARERPYAAWLQEHLIPIEDLEPAPFLPPPDHETVLRRQQAFGYTQEDVEILLGPMARAGEEPIGSMGTDTPLAVLSQRPRLLYDYFKQLFAQVTNPPLDAIREELVTSMESTIGPERNLLHPEPESCRQIVVKYPIIDNDQVAKLRHIDMAGFRSVTLPMLYAPAEGGAGLERAMDRLREQAQQAVASGHTILILSDRGVTDRLAPVPSLLATAGVHHHLVREGLRTRCALVVESGDAREVHHVALLIGYGAGAVNPYLAFETLDDMIHQRVLEGVTHERAVLAYIKALNKGILKVMSKMGISTLQSYCGAQIFEAIGLDRAFVDRYFTWTASRIGGADINVIAREALERHRRAFPPRNLLATDLETGGEYKWRRDGEMHLFNPETVHKLQHATRSGQYAIYKEYTALVNDQNRSLGTLRGLLGLKRAPTPVPLEDVEPVEAILKRFATGAMSYGSISQEAHETIAIAMNRLGAKSNTGEGGEDAARYQPDANGDSRRSAIKQVASARFGVTSEYLVNADDLQIKMAQGAKPGEGGQLPGHKVYPWIAKVRHSTPGVTLISPPPHHDIYSIEDLAQLIYDLKNANNRARIHVKLVAEVGVGTVAAGVAKAHADVVLISGHDGGTGASPLTSIKHSGVPWELGLAETQQVLVLNRLRDRIVVQVDGQLRTGRDVVVAALLGGEEFGFSTAALVVSGCIMMRVCHLNTCPVGIATQDPELRKNFNGKPEFVENYFRFVAEDVRELMAELGFRTMDEMVGRADCLEMRPAIAHWKAKGVDLERVLYQPEVADTVGRRAVRAQDHGLERALDVELIKRASAAIERREPVQIEMAIRNEHRTVGTMLGAEVTRRYGGGGLPEDTIGVHFTGSAGQSFGAFVPRGITLSLEGDANDFWGKGLSGGKLVVYPPRQSTFASHENVIVGNVCLYGATGGDAYVRGIAGERFAVRNSGASAVVEGVGDHGCEYMTAGRVVVIGRTGRNFAAGMSGGVAYVLDVDGQFERRCNTQMVDLERLCETEDLDFVRMMLRRHVRYTSSGRAVRLLADWLEEHARFVKVIPRDYKRVRLAEARAKSENRELAFAELVGVGHG